VRAPFDGIVTARQVSVGDYVGGGGQVTVLSTIVQTEPIYVNFSVNEQQIQRIREGLIKSGYTPEQIEKHKFPVEVALQTDSGYPFKGTIDYVNPTVDTSTGTVFVRGIFPNKSNGLIPGYFVRVRVPLQQMESATMVPDAALGSDQAGRYVLIVNKDNVVETRRVTIGATDGDMRVIDSGLKADDRVVVAGLMRAIPGQKVDPEMRVAAADPPKSGGSGNKTSNSKAPMPKAKEASSSKVGNPSGSPDSKSAK
jgi:RND family efflux transporter MFP subunit